MNNKDKQINEIFNILIQFEKIYEKNSNVTETTYKNYLNRLWVWYNGDGNIEISNSLLGLEKLGANVGHDTVKRIVFHIIDILNKESREKYGS